MAGSKIGGIKTAATNIEKYGADYYRNIGRIGGKSGKAQGTIKGFALNPELARIAGSKGRKISKRTTNAKAN